MIQPAPRGFDWLPARTDRRLLGRLFGVVQTLWRREVTEGAAEDAPVGCDVSSVSSATAT
ncbi:MAG: hypothetical protein A2289_14045 [Deltaproteobacteria bacterium RIFOXYA12_FULL_58_15]|nr:MAG: hypothetical protein A2289_14045 [Deltaproteobacteria bacterium RIFOXYA12_FULL_58_15]